MGLLDDTSSADDAKAKAEPVVDVAVEPMASEAEQPRDERQDSIDPATGTLTAEAVALRRAAAAQAAEG